MPLSWNEIKQRAIAFSRDWKGTTSEKSERQTFWNEFFEVFGKRRRTLATFEEPVKKLSGNWGFIDLFWPGTCLVEHKSAGQDLGKAHAQGMDYIRGLIDSGREKDAPRWLIVSDFERIAIHDLEPEQDPDLPLLKRLLPSIEFPLKELHKNVRHFAFIAGYKSHKLNPEDPANFEATELMARLHDALWDGGYRGHDLCQFLVRLLFCFFADDTGIFPSDQFKLYVRERCSEDGSDLGARLAHLFQVLNTPEDKRSKNLDEDLAQLPYVNGDLFAEPLTFADFDAKMRAVLLECADFRWEKISPAVFGSLFQTVFDHEDDRKRRQLGAHYTAEKNIMKVVRSLFLDELRAEFEAAKKDKSGRGPNRLRDLQKKLAALKIMDPACGCGNFLVVTYRELRQLELEILIELHANELAEIQHEFALDVTQLSQINVDQMYGIEIEEFPARIAEVALWLADHQANVLLSEAFGQFYRRIPLRKSPHIHVANALRKDWREVLPPEQCSFILGNPPFVGKKEQNEVQKEDMEMAWGDVQGAGVLDFVTGWYRKAANYMSGTKVVTAFVSTNSITQGEQVPILWSELLQQNHVQIHFAHQTFAWQSEARGKAHVHVVIIGFAEYTPSKRTIFEYDDINSDPVPVTAVHINAYLVDSQVRFVTRRMKPLSQVSEMVFGTKLVDDGHLTLDEHEKQQLIDSYSFTHAWIRPLIGGEEFLNGTTRWCLWLNNAEPRLLKQCPPVLERIEKVRQFRLGSKKAPTVKLAETPSLFGEIRQPDSDYLLVPKVSSERRRYLPLGYITPDFVANGSALIVPNASLYEFGILSASQHLSWMRQICGRMKSDYQYSATIVYNNYPWPPEVTEAQKAAVEKAAQAVLDAREPYLNPNHGDEDRIVEPCPKCTLADLYDPVTMPPGLVKAHADLDRAVDRCYRKEPFPNDRARVEHLFALYEKLTAPLVKYEKPKRKTKTPDAPGSDEAKAAAAHYHGPMVLREDGPEDQPKQRKERKVPGSESSQEQNS